MAKDKKSVKEDQALTVSPEAQLPSTQVMSQEEMDRMYGDLSRDHVNIPRLVLLEQLSPELADGLGKAGEFFIKGLNQNLGSAPLEVVVLMRSHTMLRWKPINEGGGIICQSQDGKCGVGNPGGDCTRCPLKEWTTRHTDEGPKTTKPDCDIYENFIVVLRKDLKAGEATPMAISGARSRLKGLRDFNTILMQSLQKRRPLFAKSYLVKAQEKTNPKVAGNNKFHVFQVIPGNENAVLPAEEQQAAYELFRLVSSKKVIIEQEPVEGEGCTDKVPY